MNQKDVAIQCLETLDVYKPYIRKFKSNAGTPCFFENFAGFYADQEPELFNKITEIQDTYGCVIYAVTHELTNFGELWSMLCVPKDMTCVEDVLVPAGPPWTYYAFTYTWNKSNDDWSEFGDIMVKSGYGGIKRLH